MYLEMIIRPYENDDEDTVVALWEACGLTRAWNNPRLDIARKLDFQRDWFLVGELDRKIIATAMFGYDGHRGWVNYLAVSPEQQKNGYARLLMEYGERILTSVGCPKINLQIRNSNTGVQAFYKAIGYGQDEVVSYGKRLIKDN
jgi:ribosomal protein S18 acetylase RimI-like enzyme